MTAAVALTAAIAEQAPRNWDIWPGYADDTAAVFVRSAQLAATDDPAAAERAALAALARDANAMPAHLLLASLCLSGPDYLHHLAALHEALEPRCYVEIGVGPGDSLTLVRPGCRVVAIDPAPRIDKPVCYDQLTLLMTTSDVFFAGGHATRTIGDEGFDLAFIDGCHRFEQVLDDFLNLERYAAPGALVAFHDTIPLDAATSTRIRQTTFYSGDAWKAIAALAELRPDLRFDTIATFPTGLTIARHLRRDAEIPPAEKARAVAAWRDASWDDQLRFQSDRLAPMPSEHESIRQLLGPMPGGGEVFARFTDLAEWRRWTAKHGVIFDRRRIRDIVDRAVASGVDGIPVTLDGENIREQLMCGGLNARERGLLAVIDRELILRDGSRILAADAVRLATVLGCHGQVETAIPSDTADWRGRFDAVVSCERLDKAPDLDAALREAGRLLRCPGGALIASFPFAWNDAADIVVHGVGPDLRPTPNGRGCYLIPGWNTLRRCRRTGFSKAEMLFIGSARRAVLDTGIAGIFVLIARM